MRHCPWGSASPSSGRADVARRALEPLTACAGRRRPCPALGRGKPVAARPAGPYRRFTENSFEWPGSCRSAYDKAPARPAQPHEGFGRRLGGCLSHRLIDIRRRVQGPLRRAFLRGRGASTRRWSSYASNHVNGLTWIGSGSFAARLHLHGRPLMARLQYRWCADDAVTFVGGRAENFWAARLELLVAGAQSTALAASPQASIARELRHGRL
jgi:hypothetical protein